MLSIPSLIESVSGGSFITLLLIFWRISKTAGAMERMLRDFPPHRHIGHDIVHPKGYSPEKPR